MLEPQNIHKLKSLQGHLAYVHRFISSLTRRCRPFNQLMKKDVPFEWDKACKNAFKIIKENLKKPPMLRAFVPSQPLIIYVATQERSYRSLLAQKHDEKKEKGLVLFKLNTNRCWDKLFTNKKIMSSIVLLNKEAKTLCLFLFSVSNFKSRSYQVHHVKATSIKTIRKMVTFTTRVRNYLHHLKNHKMPSISLFPSSLFYLNRLGAKRRLLWWGSTCSWNFHGECSLMEHLIVNGQILE